MPYQTFNQILSSKLKTPEKKLVYRNNTKRTLFFNKFDLLPDTNFIRYGSMYVTKNGITLFSSDREDKPLTQYSQFPIRDKLFTLQRDEEFEIYTNTTNTDYTIGLGVSIELEHEDIPSSSILIPYVATPQEIGSESEILFELLVRSGSNPYYKILDMKGFRNLIVLIQASMVESPTLECPTMLTDADYSYSVSTSGSQIIVKENECRFDLISGENHNINFNPSAISNVGLGSFGCRVSYGYPTHNQGSGTDGTIYYITTNAIYTRTYSIYGYDNADFSDTPETILEDVTSSQLASVQTTKRFIKMIEKMSIAFTTAPATSTHQNNIGYGDTCSRNISGTHTPIPSTFTVQDLNFVGGSAQLSFEVKDEDGNWYSYIDSDEINAVTHGGRVKVELGETRTGHILPSTPNSFRAKLEITGAIQTGVSVIRVV